MPQNIRSCKRGTFSIEEKKQYLYIYITVSSTTSLSPGGESSFFGWFLADSHEPYFLTHVFSPSSLVADVWLLCPASKVQIGELVQVVVWGYLGSKSGVVTSTLWGISVHRAQRQEGGLTWELEVKNKTKELLRSLVGRQPRHLRWSSCDFCSLFLMSMLRTQEAETRSNLPFYILCGILHGALGSWHR